MAGYADPPKPFVKGDVRINRKGRPKSFDALRALGQQIAHEPLDMADGTKRTAVEVIMRKLATQNPERFLEISFGRVPQPVEHTGKDGGPIETKTNVSVNAETAQTIFDILASVGAIQSAMDDAEDDEIHTPQPDA